MIRLLLSPFWWLQRRADVKILWPTCRDFSQNLEAAHNAFFQFAITRACWIDYYGATELSRQIGLLK